MSITITNAYKRTLHGNVKRSTLSEIDTSGQFTRGISRSQEDKCVRVILRYEDGRKVRIELDRDAADKLAKHLANDVLFLDGKGTQGTTISAEPTRRFESRQLEVSRLRRQHEDMIREATDGHASGLHAESPREFCRECDSQHRGGVPR